MSNEVRLAYPIPEAAIKIEMNRITFWRHVKSGKIPSIRIGRNFLIPAHWVEEYIAKCKGTAPIATGAEVAAE